MIEYIDDIHTYLSDGVIIPSVSQLVQFATKDDYSVIPDYILKQAQEFGNDIHKAIEDYFNGIEPTFNEPYRKLAYEQFLGLYREFIDNPICEVMVDYNERYAGRIDCLNKNTLIDFKTNTNINIPHLEWQLSFYAMALESKGAKVDKLMCLWLPKRKSGKWVEIKRIPNEKLIEILKQYERINDGK